MLHYFKWKIYNYGNYKILKNDFLWIHIIYFWVKIEWNFFLYPIMDTNNNSFYYFWFDDIKQLNIFNKFIKISWIGWKTACYISTSYNLWEIDNAILKWDLNFFKNIPWIWPKTAKKIIIELKDKISLEELENDEIKDKQKDIILKWVVSLWYSKEKVKKVLKEYDEDLSDVQKVIKDIISKL